MVVLLQQYPSEREFAVLPLWPETVAEGYSCEGHDWHSRHRQQDPLKNLKCYDIYQTDL